ncbi:zinc-binding dehydrogenase [Candidatus Dependentiae bacterium]|nr:zinc-binding dehydrogenase [Candidatus Dependentiae bacterium]
MKQVFLSQGKAVIQEVSRPLLNDTSVLVEVAYSCISPGTERATLNNTNKSIVNRIFTEGQSQINKTLEALAQNGLRSTISLVKSKLEQLIAVGYSCSGVVIAVGARVKNISVGDLVACAGSGYAMHGQFVVVPEHLTAKLIHEESLKNASATTLGAISLHALRRADIHFDEIVCVQGLGFLGLITVQLAFLAGCRVIGIDIQQDRLDLAKKYGAFSVINGQSPTALKELLFATEHHGADATIITAAGNSAEILEFATQATRRKGKIIIVGDTPITASRDELYQKEIDLLISCSYGPGRYDEQYEAQGIDYPYAYVRWTEHRNLQTIARLIDEKKLNFDDLITSEYQLQQAPEAYESLSKKTAIGIVLSYSNHSEIIDPQPEISHVPAIVFKNPSDSIKIGWIGTGGFSTTQLIPSFLKNPAISLHALSDTKIQTVVNAARQFNVAEYSNDYRHLLAIEEIDAFVIATPHKFHTEQLLDALSTGRPVFVEKPVAVTHDQLKKLYAFHHLQPTAPWHVDFNRRHSPFIAQIKKAITNRATPLAITYRINAGYIPSTHWIQSLEHGGRIVGEVCHFIHLLIYLSGSLVTRIAVSPAGKGRADMNNNDTLSIQLSFADNSIASILYAATGSSLLEKERLEIFWDGKSAILEDFKTLQGFGLDHTFNRMSSTPEKGYTQAISYFVDGIISGDLSSHVGERQRILYATEITLEVDLLAQAGGGVVDYGYQAQKLSQTSEKQDDFFQASPENQTIQL